MPFSGNKIYFEFDPFELSGVEPPKKNVREIKKRIANLVLEEVLTSVGQSRSPVAGEGWKATLSAAYKKVKSKVSGNTKANMELYGDMLDELECIVNSSGKLELRIQSSSEAPKADGHNNHSGMSALPQRRFIPDQGQTFKRDIINKIKMLATEDDANESIEEE